MHAVFDRPLTFTSLYFCSHFYFVITLIHHNLKFVNNNEIMQMQTIFIKLSRLIIYSLACHILSVFDNEIHIWSRSVSQMKLLERYYWFKFLFNSIQFCSKNTHRIHFLPCAAFPLQIAFFYGVLLRRYISCGSLYCVLRNAY